MDYEPIAEVYRGKNIDETLTDPRVESMHWGAFVVLDEQDEVLFSRGNIHHKTFIRSAAKPFQALPLIAGGGIEHFGLNSRESAIICASHNGEPVHVEAAHGILQKIGLNETHLQCGSHPPGHAASAEALIRSGKPVTALHNNCSGKHAGMLAACILKGYPVETYLDFDHPLQMEILNYVQKYSGASEVFRGTDGCSAPVFYLEIRQMARMFARLASGKDSLLQSSFSIMRTEPYMIGGDRRFDTDLMINSSVVGKVGGEAVHCVGVPPRQGRSALGLTVKVADGSYRAMYPVIMKLLTKLEVFDTKQLQNLAYYTKTPLKNHRKKHIGFVQSLEF